MGIVSKLWFYATQLEMGKHVLNTVINAISAALKTLSEIPQANTDCLESIRLVC